MTKIDTEFPSLYYDDPWIPNAEEIEEWGSLILTPSEAQYLVLNAINSGKDLNSPAIQVLRTIRDGNEPVDFIGLLLSTAE
jgi:hypothetical protein